MFSCENGYLVEKNVLLVIRASFTSEDLKEHLYQWETCPNKFVRVSLLNLKEHIFNLPVILAQ